MTRDDGPVSRRPCGTGAKGYVTGSEAVAWALRAADWRAYSAANGLSGNWSRARRYSMSPKELHALYLKQDGRCYLCGDPLPTDLARVVVEHDHSCCPRASAYKTSCGKCVRGLSCEPCNRLIAAAQDDPERLRRVADNLEAANLRVGRHERVPTSSPTYGLPGVGTPNVGEPTYSSPGVGSPAVGGTDRRLTRTSSTKTEHEDQDQPQSQDQEQPVTNSQDRRVRDGPGTVAGRAQQFPLDNSGSATTGGTAREGGRKAAMPAA